MFSRGFPGFDDDPFFSGHRERMSQLMEGGMPRLSLSDEGSGGRRRDRGGELAPARPNDIFSGMMNQMQNMAAQMENTMRMGVSSQSPGDGHSYVESSVYSYRNTGDGAPDIYAAHHSNRYAPGGIREERKAIKDTRRNLEKMGIGKHIGERGHYVEKSRNTKNNQTEEHQNLYGLTEDELNGYHREWDRKTQSWQQAANGRNKLGAPPKERRSQQKALGYHRDDTRKY